MAYHNADGPEHTTPAKRLKNAVFYLRLKRIKFCNYLLIS